MADEIGQVVKMMEQMITTMRVLIERMEKISTEQERSAKAHAETGVLLCNQGQLLIQLAQHVGFSVPADDESSAPQVN